MSGNVEGGPDVLAASVPENWRWASLPRHGWLCMKLTIAVQSLLAESLHFRGTREV